MPLTLNTPTQFIPHRGSVRLERSCCYPASLRLRSSRDKLLCTKRLMRFYIKEINAAKQRSVFARRKQKPSHL